MSFITSKEAAQKWNISDRMVRLYCTQNRIPDAYQESDIWFIPTDAAKPGRIKKEVIVIPPLLEN